MQPVVLISGHAPSAAGSAVTSHRVQACAAAGVRRVEEG